MTDSTTTDPLMYANVVLHGTPLGATTDKNGYYIIHNVPPGKYALNFTYIGYQSERSVVIVRQNEHLVVNVGLAVKNIQGNRVTVTANRQRFERMVETSRINLSARELETVPAFIEADIFRSIQMLPGVIAQNDFSAALVVRGGSPDENLILLDGIEVYNPYHFGGIFSAFNTDAIRDAEFQSGGFPVRYGGRLSSVLEITTKEGNPSGGLLGKNWIFRDYWDISAVKGEVSMLSSKIFIEGPVLNGGYIFSARRTYFDKLASLAHSLHDTIPELPYYFYDLQGKAHFQLTPSHRLDFQGYSGADNLSLSLGDLAGGRQSFDLNWIWGNRTISGILRSVLRPEMVLETMIAQSIYGFDVDFTQTNRDSLGNEVSSRFLITNLLKDWTFSEKLDWKVNSAHRLQLGVDYKRLRFKFSFDNDEVRFVDEKRRPTVASAYVQDTWRLNVLMNFQFGVRASYYSLSDQLWYDARGGFKYRFFENSALKGSIGTFTQFLFTSNNDDEVLRIVDFWLPVPEYLDPQRAIHYVLGIEQWIGDGYQASLEGYYKPYLNVLDSNPIQSVYDDTDDYISGAGIAYGVEAILKKSLGDLTGWIAYTYSRVEKQIDLDSNGEVEPDKGEVYSPKYDKRYILNLVVNYRFNKNNQVSLSWNYSSGQPYTPVVGKQYGGNSESGWFRPYLHQSDILGERNSARFPPYVRGDISYIRQFNWFGINGQFKVQILNFTNHFNVLLYQWDHSSLPSKVVASSMFPLIPTLGISFSL